MERNAVGEIASKPRMAATVEILTPAALHVVDGISDEEERQIADEEDEVRVRGVPPRPLPQRPVKESNVTPAVADDSRRRRRFRATARSTSARSTTACARSIKSSRASTKTIEAYAAPSGAYRYAWTARPEARSKPRGLMAQRYYETMRRLMRF
jgi:hypothetical protein